jgi:hypothetical protein
MTLLRHIHVNDNLFFPLELHDKEGIAGLTLAQGWIEADGDEGMKLIGLRQQHEFFDGLVLYLVVVGLSAKSE